MSEKKNYGVRYSEEFKEEAVAKCLKSNVNQTSKELGVTPSTLRDWIRRSEGAHTVSSEKPSYEELERENRRLRKELGYICEINEVLKKSTAIFSSKELGGFR